MGTPGHMAHPFDVARVQTGLDLIKYFGDIKEFLELNPGSLKIDGINVSFKLITTEGGKKEFRMDRGTTHTESVIGMNAEAAYEKWPEGHGMPPAIKTLLEIFNEALPSIQYELKDLGMWDNSSKFFNTEYVAGKTNVQKYDRNFLAIHGVNQFYEKKAPKKWVASGKSMDRKGLERPIDPKTGKLAKTASTEIPYNRGALESLIKKVEPFASQHGFEIYGDVPTKLANEIDYSGTLESPFTIQMTAEDQEVHSLSEWLKDAQNPRREKVTKSDGTHVDAISKDIYMAVLNEIPLTEYLKSPEDAKRAISGALFNHATRMLGNDVKSALDSSMGSVADHEGVVLRGMEEFPVKVTGEFIIGGMQTAFREGVIREVEELKGIKDVEEELDIHTVDMDDEEGKTKIALIPGGFKPPHRGHLALVTHYLEEVAPDGKVILYMGSGGDTPREIHGKAVTFEDALQIWKIYLRDENIAFPNEILDIKKVEGGPIGHVVDYVKGADPEREVIYLGAGEKDADRWKFMLDNPKYNPNNVKVFIEPVSNYNDRDGKPMSAENFRKAIETGEEELIKSYIPEESHKSYREIMDVLEGQLKESQQPLGIFLGLIEEEIAKGAPITPSLNQLIASAKKDAQILYRALEWWGTDEDAIEEVINRQASVFGLRRLEDAFNSIKEVVDQTNKYGGLIEWLIDDGMHKEAKRIRVARADPSYESFAKKVYEKKPKKAPLTQPDRPARAMPMSRQRQSYLKAMENAHDSLPAIKENFFQKNILQNRTEIIRAVLNYTAQTKKRETKQYKAYKKLGPEEQIALGDRIIKDIKDFFDETRISIGLVDCPRKYAPHKWERKLSCAQRGYLRARERGYKGSAAFYCGATPDKKTPLGRRKARDSNAIGVTNLRIWEDCLVPKVTHAWTRMVHHELGHAKGEIIANLQMKYMKESESYLKKSAAAKKRSEKKLEKKVMAAHGKSREKKIWKLYDYIKQEFQMIRKCFPGLKDWKPGSNLEHAEKAIEWFASLQELYMELDRSPPRLIPEDFIYICKRKQWDEEFSSTEQKQYIAKTPGLKRAIEGGWRFSDWMEERVRSNEIWDTYDCTNRKCGHKKAAADVNKIAKDVPPDIGDKIPTPGEEEVEDKSPYEITSGQEGSALRENFLNIIEETLNEQQMVAETSNTPELINEQRQIGGQLILPADVRNKYTPHIANVYSVYHGRYIAAETHRNLNRERRRTKRLITIVKNKMKKSYCTGADNTRWINAFWEECQNSTPQCFLPAAGRTGKDEMRDLYKTYLPYILETLDRVSRGAHTVIGYDPDIITEGTPIFNAMYGDDVNMGFYALNSRTFYILPMKVKALGRNVSKIIKHELEHAVFHTIGSLSQNTTPLKTVRRGGTCFGRPDPGGQIPTSKNISGTQPSVYSSIILPRALMKCNMSRSTYAALSHQNEVRSYIKSIQKESGLTQNDVRRMCQREQSNLRCGFWDIVDCSNIPRLTDAINQIAKVEPKRLDAPQTALAENFLNTIEDTIGEKEPLKEQKQLNPQQQRSWWQLVSKYQQKFKDIKQELISQLIMGRREQIYNAFKRRYAMLTGVSLDLEEFVPPRIRRVIEIDHYVTPEGLKDWLTQYMADLINKVPLKLFPQRKASLGVSQARFAIGKCTSDEDCAGEVLFADFLSEWGPNGRRSDWESSAFHELSHGKEKAFAKAIIKLMDIPRAGRTFQSFSSWEPFLKKFSKRCLKKGYQLEFDPTKRPGAAHGRIPNEWYASFMELLIALGRDIIPDDILIINASKENAPWESSEITDPVRIAGGHITVTKEWLAKTHPGNATKQIFAARELIGGNESLRGLKPGCNLRVLLHFFNEIVAQVKQAGPQTGALSENFLNMIEETIDEATVNDMFGAASGLLAPITPAGAGKRDEEEDDELEEISAAGGGAVEGFSGDQEEENEEKETLIREVGDYLFKMLGDDS